MRKLKTINFKKNIKTASSPQELKSDLWGFLAIPLYILPASLFKQNGWVGLLISGLFTWGTGAFFDIPALRRAAPALMGVHLAYAKLTPQMNDLGIAPWRLGGSDFGADAVATLPPADTGSTTNGLYGMRDQFQRNSGPINLPSNAAVTARPAFDTDLNPGTMMDLLPLPGNSNLSQMAPVSNTEETDANVTGLPGRRHRR